MKQRKWPITILTVLVMAAAGFASAAEVPEAAGLIIRGEELTINTAALSEEPAFIDWIWEETPMQLIARKDAEGQVRLAFNTCRSCYGSPWAWFEYIGNDRLQCQNCGQILPVSLVGDAEAMGCAPIPVPEYTENEDGTMIIPEHVFEEAAWLFTNWRKTGE